VAGRVWQMGVAGSRRPGKAPNDFREYEFPRTSRVHVLRPTGTPHLGYARGVPRTVCSHRGVRGRTREERLFFTHVVRADSPARPRVWLRVVDGKERNTLVAPEKKGAFSEAQTCVPTDIQPPRPCAGEVVEWGGGVCLGWINLDERTAAGPCAQCHSSRAAGGNPFLRPPGRSNRSGPSGGTRAGGRF